MKLKPGDKVKISSKWFLSEGWSFDEVYTVKQHGKELFIFNKRNYPATVFQEGQYSDFESLNSFWYIKVNKLTRKVNTVSLP